MSRLTPMSARLRDDMRALLGDAEASAESRTARVEEQFQDAQRRNSTNLSDLQARHRANAAQAERDQGLRSERALTALLQEQRKVPGALGVLAQEFPFELCEVPPNGAVIGSVMGAPVLVPLIGELGLVLRGDQDRARTFAESLFGRIVASVPLSSLRVTVFDPQVRGILGGFAELRDHAQRDSFPRAFVDEYEFQKRLERLTSSMTVMAEQLRVTGARSVTSIWRQATPAPVLDVLLVDLTPGSLRERAALERIMRRGASLGMLVIVLDPSPVPASGPVPAGEGEGDASVTTVTFDSRGSALLALRGTELSFTPLPELVASNVREVVAASIRDATSSAGPVISAERLIPAERHASSASGIEVVIGERHDGKDLTVSLRSQNPPTPNALVGGAVGQGKSNLLLALIYAIAAKYPPSEVEMLLLDFKEGLEFQRFAGEASGGWLPHAKVVALESDREFGVATLRHIAKLRSERSTLFKAAGVANYDAYREAGNPLPRVVVVVDEFQVLFDGEDELAASSVQLLDQIVRQGRVAGIHIVLATQTLSGIRSLATRLDGILAQVSTRISLWNPESESQAILSPGNRAAARLRFRGEVVLNSGGGQNPEENLIGMSTYAEPGFTGRLQRRLWEEHPEAGRTHVFIGTSYATRTPPRGSPPAGSVGTRSIALGAAVDVLGSPVAHVFGADPMNSLAVVGSDGAIRDQLVRVALESALASGRYQRIVLIGDANLVTWAAPVPGSVPGLVTIEHADAAAWLLDAGETLQQSGTFVVVADLQRVGGLANGVHSDPDDPFSAKVTGHSVLQGLATAQGSGCDLLVSSQSFAALDQTFGYARDGSGGIGAYALAGVPLADLRQILGFHAEAPQGNPRFVFAAAGGSESVVAVPYALGSDGQLLVDIGGR